MRENFKTFSLNVVGCFDACINNFFALFMPAKKKTREKTYQKIH